MIKITPKWYAYDSNPSPLNLTKYSQPYDLALFHVINLNIKCHKDSTTRIYKMIIYLLI